MNLLDCANNIGKVFHRKIYHFCDDWIKGTSPKRVLLLTGPRRCGKSTCLTQLGMQNNVRIYNFKEMTDIDEQDEIMCKVCESTDGIFLLDEVTYIMNYSQFMWQIADSITRNVASGIRDTRRIIITGSQEYALQYASRKMLSAEVEMVHTSFIDFEEWLVWRGRMSVYNQVYTPTNEDFYDYMVNSIEFTKTSDNLQYIKDCLQETIESEYKTLSSPIGMIPSGIVSAEEINSVLNTVLISMHNRFNRKKMYTIKDSLLAIKTGNPKMSAVKVSDISERINVRLSSLSTAKSGLSFKTLCACLVFLQQCDLITITEVTEDVHSRQIEEILRGKEETITSVDAFLAKVNVCVKHPMFYFNLLRELLDNDNDLTDKIPSNVYGSAYECVMRGVFSYREHSDFLIEHVYSSEEYQGEIDLVIPSVKECYEFTVSNTHGIQHLTAFSDKYKKYLFYNGRPHKSNDVIYENYVEALLLRSRGLFNKVKPSDIYWLG